MAFGFVLAGSAAGALSAGYFYILGQVNLLGAIGVYSFAGVAACLGLAALFLHDGPDLRHQTSRH